MGSEFKLVFNHPLMEPLKSTVTMQDSLSVFLHFREKLSQKRNLGLFLSSDFGIFRDFSQSVMTRKQTVQNCTTDKTFMQNLTQLSCKSEAI